MKHLRITVFVFILSVSVVVSRAKDIDSSVVNDTDTEVYNSVSEPWETIFQKIGGTRYKISSKKDRKFKIILNRYQNPLPMIQFYWKCYTICYYDYFGISSNSIELGSIVQTIHDALVLKRVGEWVKKKQRECVLIIYFCNIKNIFINRKSKL